MKLYKYVFGDWEKFGAAHEEEDAFNRRIDVDPQFHYVPVMIEEVILEGYEIVVNRIAGDTVETMSRDQLKQYLTEKNIEFTPQWGEQKLRELALQHI